MTREEAIKELKEYEDGLDLEYATPFDKAIMYAIKALEQEPIDNDVVLTYDMYHELIADRAEKLEQESILDKIDEIITDALDKSTDQKESQTLRWVLDKISEVM